MSDRYGSDVLARNPNARKRSTEQPAEKGLVVECATTGFVGAVISVEYGRMVLEDFDGYRKPFPIGPGYLVDGNPVILTAPKRSAPCFSKEISFNCHSLSMEWDAMERG